jgi:hypothetical protein
MSHIRNGHVLPRFTCISFVGSEHKPRGRVRGSDKDHQPKWTLVTEVRSRLYWNEKSKLLLKHPEQQLSRMAIMKGGVKKDELPHCLLFPDAPTISRKRVLDKGN